MRVISWHASPSCRIDRATARQGEQTDALHASETRHLAELKAEMTPPDLQELVAVHGGYNKITPEAWDKFDRKTKTWRERMIRGDFWHQPYKDLR